MYRINLGNGILELWFFNEIVQIFNVFYYLHFYISYKNSIGDDIQHSHSHSSPKLHVQYIIHLVSSIKFCKFLTVVILYDVNQNCHTQNWVFSIPVYIIPFHMNVYVYYIHYLYVYFNWDMGIYISRNGWFQHRNSYFLFIGDTVTLIK